MHNVPPPATAASQSDGDDEEDEGVDSKACIQAAGGCGEGRSASHSLTMSSGVVACFAGRCCT
eukprot:scaffold41083_cov191-Amphora_coffeaeformis.AAC.2